MTRQSQRRRRQIEQSIDHACSWAILLLVFAAICWTIAVLLTTTGCTASTRTRVEPAATNATHQTQIQRPGRTRTRTIELELSPQESHQPSATGHQGGMQSLAQPKYTPFASSESGAGTVVNAAIVPAGWGKDRNEPGTAASGHPEVTPDMVEAIRAAVEQGFGAKLKITETDETPLTTETSSSTLDDRGAGLDTHSDEAAIGFDGKKSGANLPWGGRSGSTKWGLDASLTGKGVNALHIFGAIVMLGAIVPLVIPPRRWGAAAIVAGTGLLIIAAGTVSEQAPWVFIAAIVAFLGIAGWLGYEAWRSKRRKVALEAIAKGVEDADPEYAEAVKSKIAKAAGDLGKVVKAEVTAVKNKAGIQSTT